MNFKSKLVNSLFNRAKILSQSSKTYDRLLSFEKTIHEHLRFNELDISDEKELKRAKALASLAQIQVIERDLDEDLDGDGKIGSNNLSIKL